MKKSLLILTTLAALLAPSARAAISVGPSPTGTGILTFDTQPAVTDWSTLSPGGASADFTTAAALDAGIQTNVASGINVVLGTSATLPISANALARRHTANMFLMTPPTGVAYTMLLATLQNDTGAAATGFTVEYDLGENSQAGTTVVEEIPGHRVFWSLSGTAGSWQLIPELSSAPLGRLSATVSAGTWSAGSPLYLLFVDDNAAADRNNSGNEEGGYTIDNFTLIANQGVVPPSIAILTPTNNAVYPQSTIINVTTLVRGPINSVDFLVDGSVVASDATSPFGFALDSTIYSLGNHVLRARANVEGGSTIETNANFTLIVNNPPTIAITNVYSGTVTGTTFLVGSAVVLQTRVSDDVAVTNMEWYIDGQPYILHRTASDNNFPNITYVDSLAGTHEVYGVAVDNSGLRTLSSVINLTITNPPPNVTQLITNGSEWLYYGTDLSQGINFPPPSNFGGEWTAVFYDLTGWTPLMAEIGGGDAVDGYPEKSVVDIGPANGRYLAHYFRKSFEVSNLAAYENLRIRLLRDDGAIVYLNGISVWTNNMGTTDPEPGNSNLIGYTNRANASDDGLTYQVLDILGSAAIASVLQEGANEIAVEVHQQNNTSSDFSFDLMLWGETVTAPTVVITSPTNGTTVIEGSSIAVSATGGTFIETVRFDLDGVPQVTDNTPPSPFTGTILNLPAGTHNITAFATDIFGANVTSLPVTINVIPDTLPVSVITSTVSANVTNGTYLVGSALTNTFYVADDVSVTNVTCYLNGAFYFSPTNGLPTAAHATNTITVFVNDALAGTNSFVVAAVDTRGRANYSAPPSVLVTNPPLALLLTNGSSWTYFNTSNAPPADVNTLNWFQPNYIQTTWSSGLAPLGGRGAVNTKEGTILDLGPAADRHRTAYFLKSINVANPGAYSGLTLNILRDDGAVVYINGQPVWTNNITSLALDNGIIAYTNLAVNAPGDNGTRYQTTTISTAALVPGNNLVAVEMHQNSITSSDIVFDLMLWGQAPASAPPIHIENTGTQIRVTWTGTAVLQQADVLTVPPAPSGFSDVTGNPTSPYIINLPIGGVKFFRLRSP